jgi:hypothetical protein
MASAEAVAVAALITTRLGGATSPRLIQLTNSDGTATAIDSDVLEAACEDALSEFRILTTGIEPEPGTYAHQPALITGSLYYLEFYKGRDSAILSAHKKDFYSKCKSIAEMKYLLAQSNSVLTQSSETSGARPDMDRRRAAFTGGVKFGSGATPSDTWED